MECSEIRSLLSEYLDDALSPSVRTLMEDHLAACGECAEELSALRSCIAATGSLDRIQAPPDFLKKVRERMERESAMKRLLRKVFLPWHIKIPLEVAGVAASALLILLMQPGLKPREHDVNAPKIAEAPAPAPAKPLVGETAQTLKDEGLKWTEARRTQAQSGHVPESEKTIELALLIGTTNGKERAESKQTGETFAPSRTSPTRASEAGRAAKSAAPPGSSASPLTPSMMARETPPSAPSGDSQAPEEKRTDGARSDKSDKALRKAERLQEAPNAESSTAPKGEAESAFDPMAVLTRVQNAVSSSGGTTLSIAYEEGTNLPRSLVVRIPAGDYSSFLKKLRAMGELRESSEKDQGAGGTGPVQLRIRLLLGK